MKKRLIGAAVAGAIATAVAAQLAVAAPHRMPPMSSTSPP